MSNFIPDFTRHVIATGDNHQADQDTQLCMKQGQLEQLERLRSEDTPRRPMITPYYWPVYFEKLKF